MLFYFKVHRSIEGGVAHHLLLSRYIPNTGSRTDPEVSVSPANCLKEVIESGYTQSTLLPQQLLGRTVAQAIEPAFH